jgi:hypothetical protein
MTRLVHTVDIVRITVRAADALDPGDLRQRIEEAVAHALATVALPAGRTARASTTADAGLLRGNAAIAGAVGAGVADAVRGGGSDG